MSVRSPYADSAAVSRDGTISYATVTLDGQAQDVPAADIRRIIDTAKAAGGDGLRVEVGGEAVTGAEKSGGGAAEGVGLLAALVILVLLFGSLLAASLPDHHRDLRGRHAIGLLTLASHTATVADYTTPLMILVGLGVGIDYALLLFSRFRSELIAGQPREPAARRALDTAGRTVFFAGGTVIIALLGLVTLGLGSLQGVAVGVALTVLVTMLASLTLLPALLAILGGRVERSYAVVPRDDGRQGAALGSLVGVRPAATVDSRADRAGRAVGLVRTRVGHAARLGRRRQRRAGPDQPPGVRPARRPGSVRASTGRCSSWYGATRRRPARLSAHSPRRPASPRRAHRCRPRTPARPW